MSCRSVPAVPGELAAKAALVRRLRALAAGGLERMYRADARSFVFRLRQRGSRVVAEGTSHRYTAIALIGLAADAEPELVLPARCRREVCDRLLRETRGADNLGDVALTIWAAHALGQPIPRATWERLGDLRPLDGLHPVVELSWALAAVCLEPGSPVPGLRERLARRLIASFDRRAATFPHLVGAGGAALRSHVSSFADLVYPVHALAHYARVSGDHEALEAALPCVRHLCRSQGTAGQWWWHYDRRTAAVIERYPVYAVHQDAMAPMALFALQDASGVSFDAEIARGLGWLAHAPELDGGSLIDEEAGLIWRKVARREPRKLSRYAQALASGFHTDLRVPGLDTLLPPRAVDHEDRPYHLGWVLYAWAGPRLGAWEAGGVSR